MMSDQMERIKAKLVLTQSPLYTSKAIVTALSWSCDGRKLALACQDYTLKILQTNELTTKQPITLIKHTDEISNPTDKDRLASVSHDKSVCLWNLKDDEVNPAAFIQTQGVNISACWHPDGSTIAVGNKSDLITFINVKDGLNPTDGYLIIRTLQCHIEINEIGWNYDENLFFMTTAEGKIRILDYPSLELAHQVEAHSANCYCIEFDPKGRYFATGGVEAIVGLWELNDYTCIKTYGEIDEEVRGLSFSYDGELLAIGTASNLVIVLLETGETVHTIKCPDGVTRLQWHPSKPILAYGRSAHVCKKSFGATDRCIVCNGDSRYNRTEATAGIFGMIL